MARIYYDRALAHLMLSENEAAQLDLRQAAQRESVRSKDGLLGGNFHGYDAVVLEANNIIQLYPDLVLRMPRSTNCGFKWNMKERAVVYVNTGCKDLERTDNLA